MRKIRALDNPTQGIQGKTDEYFSYAPRKSADTAHISSADTLVRRKTRRHRSFIKIVSAVDVEVSFCGRGNRCDSAWPIRQRVHLYAQQRKGEDVYTVWHGGAYHHTVETVAPRSKRNKTNRSNAPTALAPLTKRQSSNVIYWRACGTETLLENVRLAEGSK